MQISHSTFPIFATFIAPWLALAAAGLAVALPILIHLLSRQRYQVVPWAAIRFLVQAEKQHKRRVDRWILLASRISLLLIALLGLVASLPWAEPVWQAIKPGKMESVSTAPRTHHVILVDSSLSMAAQNGQSTRFELALELAEKVVRNAPSGDGFSVIQLGSVPVSIIPGPVNEPEKVIQELRAMEVEHGSTDLAGGLALAADALNLSGKNYPRREVLIFTDMQRSAFAGLLPASEGQTPEVWRKLLGRSDVAFVDVAGQSNDNLAVTSLRLSDTLPIVDTPTAVTATVHNFGESDKSNVRIELALSRPSSTAANPLPVEQRVIDRIPSGQQVTITLPLDGAARFREPGLHYVQLRILDNDALPIDNTRGLAVNVRTGLPVTLVNGTASTDPFNRASEYLLEALSPTGRTVISNPARPRVLSLTEFSDAALGDLGNTDCVFLCDVPNFTASQVSRLEAFLKRGGGMIIGMGPNVAQNLDHYNRVLYAEGEGLLPGQLLGVKSVKDTKDLGFRLTATEAAYRQPPLEPFRNDNARAGLIGVPFRRYVVMDAPADGVARRILSFTPAELAGSAAKEPTSSSDKPDPALVEFSKHRGRVIVYTSSFNTSWTDWPILPSFLPMAHEMMRYTAASPDRHTFQVGETLEDFVPISAIGLEAAVTKPDGQTASIKVEPGEDFGVLRFSDTRLSGSYKVAVPGQPPETFHANPALISATGAYESDLRPILPEELLSVGPVQIVADPDEVRIGGGSETVSVLKPRAHGPKVAKWFVLLAFGLLLLELFLAWRLGPSRTALSGIAVESRVAASNAQLMAAAFRTALAALLCLTAFALVVAVLYARQSGTVLQSLPAEWKNRVEQSLGVPPSGSGENTVLRLESQSVFGTTTVSDQWLLIGLTFSAVLATLLLYRLEVRGAGSIKRLIVPFGLRLAAICLAVWIFLPQLQLSFQRQGWPDIAVIIDTSMSMSVVDEWSSMEEAKAAEQLELQSATAEASRFQLAKALLNDPGENWLGRLVGERQYKTHLFRLDERPSLLQPILDEEGLAEARTMLNQMLPDGEESRLGDGINSVLKSFRGGSLSAIVILTDGIVTTGDDLSRAARRASRAGVPIYFVGIGDSQEPLDFALTDIQAEDLVLTGDELIFEARVLARGGPLPKQVPVILSEKIGNSLTELSRTEVKPDPSGRPVPFRLTTIPEEPGDRTYVLEIPEQEGETELSNNRIEKPVYVTDSRTLRVLYIEGYPRYEFRFVKALLEREAELGTGSKSVELSTLLLDASTGYAEQDKSALRTLPTQKELFDYDVVILGDIEPNSIPRAGSFFQDLSEFVKVRGGGLLFIAGSRANPQQFFNTALSELLPIVPEPSQEAPANDNFPPEGFRPSLSSYGQTHPLFRFSSDEGENAQIWAGLQPLIWYSTGYKRKKAAEVLAYHPERSAAEGIGDKHPIVLQQFVGAGRVVFFGTDETWRWRFRQDEDRFNQFWAQAVRVLARNRISRIELRTDKQTSYRQGDPIRVTVQFPDDAPPPDENANVSVTIDRTPLTDESGQPIGPPPDRETVKLSKVEGTRAKFETLLTRTPVGSYNLTLNTPEVEANTPKAEAKVLPPPGEMERLQLDAAAMTRAAAESRGYYLTIATAQELFDKLPLAEPVMLSQPVPPIPVWNHALLYLLLIGILGMEWWIRRSARLL